MNKKCIYFMAFLILLIVPACIETAQVLTYTGTGGTIVDGVTVYFPIEVTEDKTILDFIKVILTGFQHPAAADVRINLYSPSLHKAIVLEGIQTTAAFNGNYEFVYNCSNYSSNYAGNSSGQCYEPPEEQVAEGIIIPDLYEAKFGFAPFVNKQSLGTWILEISDLTFTGSDGSLASWSIVFNTYD